MKQLHGLNTLISRQGQRLNVQRLAELLLDEFHDGCCLIFGSRDEEPVLLAELAIQADSLQYEMFDQRIDMTLMGDIIRDDRVPLTYRVQGRQFSVTGRCSMLPKVCGVDWYLGAGYSGRAGDQATLRFKIDVKEVLRQKEKTKD